MNSWPGASEPVHGGRNKSLVQWATLLTVRRQPSRLAPGGASPAQDRLQQHAGRNHRLDWHDRRVDGTLFLKRERGKTEASLFVTRHDQVFESFFSPDVIMPMPDQRR